VSAVSAVTIKLDIQEAIFAKGDLVGRYKERLAGRIHAAKAGRDCTGFDQYLEVRGSAIMAIERALRANYGRGRP